MKHEHSPVTITLNPAIDETVFLDQFRVGEVNRSQRLHVQAGGKGINVSRMLSSFGIPTIATGFLGKENKEIYKNFLDKKKVGDAFVWIPGETRTGIKIVSERTRQTTDINFPGLEPSLAALDEFETKIRKLIRPGRWFVLAGSLPRGLGIDFFEELIVLLKRGGALVAVDTSGDPLRVAVEQGVDLVKPNEHELAEVLDRPLHSFSEKVEAALDLQQNRVPRVILSLGSEGALFLSPEKQLMASAPPVKVVSTVGAGDALLSGYLAGILGGETAMDCARLATVFAWSNLENIERKLPSREKLRERLSQIQVQTLSKM
ncbi:1-phosphofructokinase [Kiritimatiellaeota bacterium B1221]|nr:1-phosphofructokinase [Kiritimatiellaeota bacterium B1221]